MKSWILVFTIAPIILVSCINGDEISPALLNQTPKPKTTAESKEDSESTWNDSSPECPTARGEGTVSPAVSVYSITFMVNGVDQVLYDGDTLDAKVGDEIGIREVVICTEAYSGSGGNACVDFVPVGLSGQEITSEHAGTHLVPVTSGFISITGPNSSWILDGNWEKFSAVLNHWTPENTEDEDCANRLCERDDWVVIELP